MSNLWNSCISNTMPLKIWVIYRIQKNCYIVLSCTKIHRDYSLMDWCSNSTLTKTYNCCGSPRSGNFQFQICEFEWIPLCVHKACIVLLAVGAISETQLQGDEVDMENMFQVCFVPVPRETIPQGHAEECWGGGGGGGLYHRVSWRKIRIGNKIKQGSHCPTIC